MIFNDTHFSVLWQLRGRKVAKRPIMRGVSGFSVAAMLKRRDGLNKKSLFPASLYFKMKAKLLETMKEMPLLILK